MECPSSMLLNRWRCESSWNIGAGFPAAVQTPIKTRSIAARKAVRLDPRIIIAQDNRLITWGQVSTLHLLPINSTAIRSALSEIKDRINPEIIEAKTSSIDHEGPSVALSHAR